MFNNYSDTKYYARETNLMYRVYAWMCFALAITAATAYFIATSPTFINMPFLVDLPALPYCLAVFLSASLRW